MTDPDRNLINGVLPAVTSAPVAHYTRLGTLPHLVGSTGWVSAWATPVQFLNDRRELTLGLEVLREVAGTPPMSSQRVRHLIESLLNAPGALRTDAFQMSFSGNEDDLGQWRGYGANGMGCAVVTDAAAVRTAADIAGWVIYDPKRQGTFARKVLESLRGRTDTPHMEQALVAAACFIKDEGFRPEREFRLVCFAATRTVRFRGTGDRLVPFIDYLEAPPGRPVPAPLPLRRVVIGPGWQLGQLSSSVRERHHVMLGVRRLLEERRLTTVGVVHSAIPFDPR